MLTYKSCFVVSWRSIPQESVLRNLKASCEKKSASILVSVNSNPNLDHCVPFDPNSMTLRPTDGSAPLPELQYAACNGVYYIRSMEKVPLLTKPTSMLFLLSQLAIKEPGSVAVCPYPSDPAAAPSPSPRKCTLSITISNQTLPIRRENHSQLSLMVEGTLSETLCTMDSLSSFRFDVEANSILRYCYGV